MAARVGIDVHPSRVNRRTRQSKQHQHEQQVMLGVVERVLHSPEQDAMHEPRDGSHAEAME